MIVLLHVLSALTSMVLATYTAIVPSRLRLRISYGLVGFTLISGTYLAVSLHTHILATCMTGLFYTGFVLVGITSAHRRLALSRTRDKDPS